MKSLTFYSTKRKGMFVSHKDGLTQDQVSALASLKAGDKLVIYKNDTDDGGVYLSLKKFIPVTNNKQ